MSLHEKDQLGGLGDDSEKQDNVSTSVDEASEGSPPSRVDTFFQKFSAWVTRNGLEGHGIEPTGPEERNDKRIYQMFFIWFAGNVNVQAFATAVVGPAVFGLGLKTAFATVVVVDIIASIFPAFFAVFGPKLGTRAMVFTRFSWGYYGAIIPSILNVVTMQGYLVINIIIGGQTLAASSSHLDATLGIVIISLISLGVTFCGYQTLHWYELTAWIPNVIGMITMVVTGAKSLATIPLGDPVPATAASIMTFGAAVAVSVIAWSSITPDYGIFHNHKAPGVKIFIYSYLGFLLSSVSMHLLGSAFAAGAAYNPEWHDGLGNGSNVGGLLGAVFAPTGGFGKAMLVLMALTTPSTSAPTMYTVCTSLMTVAQVFAKVPRAFIAVVSTAILIPVAIVGAKQFFDTFLQILSLIGYWLGPFVGIVITEHVLFRRSWSSYSPLVAWNKPHHPNLARGYAAVFSFFTSVAPIVLCMSQDWWTGPVARAGAGDVGMIVAFGYAVCAFALTRWLELRWTRETIV